MDPNEALRQIILTAKQLHVDVTRDIKIAHADDLAELVLGLHDWINGGGFLPAAWQKGDGGSHYAYAALLHYDPDKTDSLVYVGPGNDSNVRPGDQSLNAACGQSEWIATTHDPELVECLKCRRTDLWRNAVDPLLVSHE
jgi:hypothetical protein